MNLNYCIIVKIGFQNSAFHVILWERSQDNFLINKFK